MPSLFGSIAQLRASQAAGRQKAEEDVRKQRIEDEERAAKQAADQRAIERDALAMALNQFNLDQAKNRASRPQPPVEGTPEWLEWYKSKSGIDAENEERIARARASSGAGRAPQRQVVQTRDGFAIVDVEEGTSRPVAEPGKPLGDEQLQPRETGGAGRALRMKAIENRTRMRVIDDAITKIGANPSATGLQRGIPILGDIVNQRADPSGIDTRAAIADVGSLVIHDRSGAAVTAAEWPRLQPFIPKINDTHEAVIRKLQRMKQIIESETAELEAAGGSAAATGGRASGAGPGLNAAPPPSASLPPLQQHHLDRAKADPGFAAFLRKKGYDIP